MDSFCVGAIRHSARLLGALGRDLGQMPTSLALQSAHSNFTRPVLLGSALIRGHRFTQPNTALQPTALSGRFYHLAVATSFVRFILFLLSRAAAER